jgi:hypothetical protein
MALGAWAAMVPMVLALVKPPPPAHAFLPGVVAALAGALIVHGRPRSIVVGGLFAVGAALWYVVSPLDHLYEPGATLAAIEWVTFFFAPSMLIMVVGVHALGLLEAPDPVDDARAHPPHPLRARDPRRRRRERRAHVDRREPHGHGRRRV